MTRFSVSWKTSKNVNFWTEFIYIFIWSVGFKTRENFFFRIIFVMDFLRKHLSFLFYLVYAIRCLYFYTLQLTAPIRQCHIIVRKLSFFFDNSGQNFGSEEFLHRESFSFHRFLSVVSLPQTLET